MHSPERVRDQVPTNGEAPNSLANSSATLPENMESTSTPPDGSQINNSSERDFVIVSMDDNAKSPKMPTEAAPEPGDIHSLHPIVFMESTPIHINKLIIY